MYFPEDVFAFFESNTFLKDAGGRAFVQVVADENETLAMPENAGSLCALDINVRWKPKFPDEVDELNPPIFFNHQHFSNYGRDLRVIRLLALYLD